MTGYRIVLACLTDADTAAATLNLALSLGATHGALVEALHVRADPTAALPLIGDGMPGTMVEEMLRLAERQGLDLARTLRQKFDEACALHNIPAVQVPPEVGVAAARWHEVVGREDDVLMTQGRLADVIVISRLRQGHDSPSPVTINAALLDSGRPLLLAPPSPLAPGVGRRVAVFWNSSGPAARAVSNALPILIGAERVKVLSARDDGRDAQPEQLTQFLERHEIAAEYKSFTAGSDIGQALIDETAAFDGDLVVLGAYSYNRLRQLILGGVTRHILSNTPIPALITR